MSDETRFYEIDPTNENYWRAIILFGRNSASFKFALAKSLYDMRKQSNDLVRLDELAPHFSRHICEHLKKCDTQGIRNQSKFLDHCRTFNAGELSKDFLVEQTLKLGFQNVIDAFHNVHGREIPNRFFLDERKFSKGIRLTEKYYTMAELPTFSELIAETEARWRLVETAWDLKLPNRVLAVTTDEDGQQLHTCGDQGRRISITSTRDALNGYQKGRCFYCFRDISVDSESHILADVDHFFPHKLFFCANNKPINGVANLVLACKECNRGAKGKFDRLPALPLLERLYRRNEYLIKSHHPLRETLMMQTGMKESVRRSFLQEVYNCAHQTLVSQWLPESQADSVF